MFLIEFLNSLLIITFLICFTYSIGTFFLKLTNINNSYSEVITGYCLIVVLTNTLFFFRF